MGSWFSNLNIKKSDTVTMKVIENYIAKMMLEQQFLPAESENEADGAFAIVSQDDSRWFTVYSDLFMFDNPKSFSDIASPMSEKLGTDVLGISCFDSDYLFLNLIDYASGVDAWVGVGYSKGLGINRRSNISAWKGKVDDFHKFKESVKKKFDCAEDVLAEIEQCINLPPVQSMGAYEYLAELNMNEAATFLYFKLPEGVSAQELPKLVQRQYSLMPCFLDKPSIVSGLNIGGASRGLAVYFVGPYVEHDEITFSDVCLLKDKNRCLQTIPIELKKVQLSDGQWAYYYHDPGFKIMPKVDERLPVIKRMNEECEREITVRFIPHGNPRKILDITVVLVPDKNHAGQTGWNVWHHFGSKKAFIEQHNNTWRGRGSGALVLREDDFD